MGGPTTSAVSPRACLVRDLAAMTEPEGYVIRPIGVVRSTLRAVTDAPNQAVEGAPEAVL